MSCVLLILLAACGETPTAPLPATPSDHPDALRFRLRVVEQGPLELGPVAGATVTLYDAIDLATPLGAARSDALGWAEVPARKTEGAWVARVEAEAHHDAWFWADQPAGPDYRSFEALGVLSEADWALSMVDAAGFEEDAAVVVVEVPGTGSATLSTAPPASRVAYLAGGLPDPSLSGSPIGVAMASVPPGPVSILGHRGGQEARRDVVAWPGAVVGAYLFSAESVEGSAQGVVPR